MKKAGVLIIISLILANFLALNLVLAQESPPGLPSELQKDPSELLEEYRNKTLTKWDYLGKEWKIILLNNKYIGKADSIFTQFSIVFKILFNMDYSFSISLLVIILLWIFFAFEAGNLIQKGIGIKSSFIAFLYGAGTAIILAHLKILILITKMTGWLVTARTGWVWNIVMSVVIILIFVFLYYFGGILSEILKKKREERKKKEGELTIATIKAWWKGFKEGKK